MIHTVLAGAELGTVVAVWEDGTATLEPFGFRGWKSSYEVEAEPLTTFVAGSNLSRDEIARRLLKALNTRALRKLGL